MKSIVIQLRKKSPEQLRFDGGYEFNSCWRPFLLGWSHKTCQRFASRLCKDCRHALTAGQTHFLTRPFADRRSMALPFIILRRNAMKQFSASNNGRRRLEEEEPAVQDDTAELPLSPEEDMPVIPDDERVIDVPS